MQEKQVPSVRVHANGALDPEDQFRATLDQALIQLQGEASLSFLAFMLMQQSINARASGF